jgi:hypothetical protein
LQTTFITEEIFAHLRDNIETHFSAKHIDRSEVRIFASVSHAVKNIRGTARQNGRGSIPEKLGSLAMSSFVRYCAWRRTHPMSGGVMRVKLDHVSDYIGLRKRVFDIDLAPLPKSLKVPTAESSFETLARIVVNSLTAKSLTTIS